MQVTKSKDTSLSSDQKYVSLSFFPTSFSFILKEYVIKIIIKMRHKGGDTHIQKRQIKKKLMPLSFLA